MKTFVTILLYIWQLPQNLLGLVIKAFYKENAFLMYRDKKMYVCPGLSGGISLGNTVIVGKYPFSKKDWNLVKHEFGHTRQSLYLGPLYLIVVGLPSILWALLQERVIKKDYHWFYTERWADKLGNVQR